MTSKKNILVVASGKYNFMKLQDMTVKKVIFYMNLLLYNTIFTIFLHY